MYRPDRNRVAEKEKRKPLDERLFYCFDGIRINPRLVG